MGFRLKPAVWIMDRPQLLGTRGTTTFDPGFNIDDPDLPPEKPVLPQRESLCPPLEPLPWSHQRRPILAKQHGLAILPALC